MGASRRTAVYRLTVADGKKERITTLTGANQVTVPRMKKYLAILYSYSTNPELFLPGGEQTGGKQTGTVTDKAQSAEFRLTPIPGAIPVIRSQQGRSPGVCPSV